MSGMAAFWILGRRMVWMELRGPGGVFVVVFVGMDVN